MIKLELFDISLCINCYVLCACDVHQPVQLVFNCREGGGVYDCVVWKSGLNVHNQVKCLKHFRMQLEALQKSHCQHSITHWTFRCTYTYQDCQSIIKTMSTQQKPYKCTNR